MGEVATQARIGRRPPPRRTDRAGTAEAAQDGSSAGVEQHVGGVEVAVDEAGTVESPDGGGHREGDGDGLLRRHGDGEVGGGAGADPTGEQERPLTLGQAHELDDAGDLSPTQQLGFGLQPVGTALAGFLRCQQPALVPHDPDPLAHAGAVWTETA